ncbi:hypothetical protein C8R47DRAFT_1141922 [Mycena vitilis]|nr:hypothetical protein C8R47DRAFT_1141922 [Mycena vitilis]
MTHRLNTALNDSAFPCLSMPPPPLLGDGQRNYRVHVVGNSGAGKSTVGKQLADILGVPFIGLDTLFWNSGWHESTDDEMRAKVQQALANAPKGWVVDGNYTNKIGRLVADSATDVIWLDPPLLLYAPRLSLRTFLRLFRFQEDCSPGCPEQLSKMLFSKDSIIWFCISRHWFARKREGAKMAQIGLGIGSDIGKQKMRRIGGWGGELRAWFADVKRMLKRE